MIDLHLHLDGSLSFDDFAYLSSKHGMEFSEQEYDLIHVPSTCSSLVEYLKYFEYPLMFMQEKDDLIYVAYSLASRLAKMGYIYAEIRFAPLLHLQKGLTQKEVVEATLQGINKAIKENPNFDCNLILCCMRHAPRKENIETVEMANKFKKQKVVAIDLAGDETLHPCDYYKDCFALAKKYKLNITIHAGESTPNEEIMLAIDMGAKRIGHGVHLSLDERSISKVKSHHISFEFCPTSNLQTKSLSSYRNVPIMEFIRYEIPATINSDNMTASNTDVFKEFHYLIETFGFDKKDIFSLLLNSIECSFTSKATKKKLHEKLLNNIDWFYSKVI